MTNKIIINGIDVSGCEFYHHTVCDLHCEKYHNNTLSSLCCKYNPNCYFKQCARKDERVRELEQVNAQLVFKLEKLAYENGELKQKLSLIVKLCDEIEQRDFSCTLNIDCDSCTENEPCNDAFQQDREIYFKKAQQIKHIAQGE